LGYRRWLEFYSGKKRFAFVILILGFFFFLLNFFPGYFLLIFGYASSLGIRKFRFSVGRLGYSGISIFGSLFGGFSLLRPTGFFYFASLSHSRHRAHVSDNDISRTPATPAGILSLPPPAWRPVHLSSYPVSCHHFSAFFKYNLRKPQIQLVPSPGSTYFPEIVSIHTYTALKTE
jgi:hypothetical protein